MKENNLNEVYNIEYFKSREEPELSEILAKKLYHLSLPNIALDVGCGRGHLIKALRSLGVEAYGIDISEYATKNAVSEVLRGNGRKLPFRTNLFDLVVCMETLEHIEHPEEAVKEMKRVLKSNGYLFLSTPKPNSKFARQDPTHKTILPKNKWLEMFQGMKRYRVGEDIWRNIQAKYYSKAKSSSIIGKILEKTPTIKENLIRMYLKKNSIPLLLKNLKSDSLFIHTHSFHNAHQNFARSINADCLEVYFGEGGGKLKRLYLALKYGIKYPKYSYYLLEGGMPLLPMMINKLLKKRRRKVIALLGDETVINFHKKLPYYSFTEILVHKIASKFLDGAIAVSPMIKEYAEILNIPVETARPSIDQDLYEKLGKIRSNLNGRDIVSVGYSKPSIGMDIVVEGFKLLNRKDITLYIVGRGHPKRWENSNIHVLGWVNDLVSVLKRASLFVHPARAGAYPVATLEAMRGGIPTIVSTMTGTKDVVFEVENELKEAFGSYNGFRMVIPPRPEEVAESIEWYFTLPFEKKAFLSERFKEKSRQFNPISAGKQFRKAYEKIKELIE